MTAEAIPPRIPPVAAPDQRLPGVTAPRVQPPAEQPPSRTPGIVAGSLTSAGLIGTGAILICMAAMPVVGWIVAAIGAILAVDVLGDAVFGFSFMRALSGKSFGEWIVSPFMPRPSEPRDPQGVNLRRQTLAPPRADLTAPRADTEVERQDLAPPLAAPAS